MARDYASIVAALRAKADDDAVPEAEAKTLRAKADDLEREHGPFTKGMFAFTILPPTVRPSRRWDDWLDDIVDDDYLYDS